MKNKIFWPLMVVIFLAAISLVGCKPYDKPEYVDIKPNETAFLIPLTGKTSDQTTLLSEEFLRKGQVSTKRVQITHEWSKTGFNETDGVFIPNVRLILVDRTPVSTQWLANDVTHRVSVESAESIGLIPGVSITAFVDESDAARFLYKYANKPLAAVVDSDVNNYVKGRFSAAFSGLTLDQAKAQKQRIFEAVFKETVEQFKPYGITVAQLGQTDGLTYENPAIQEKIDTRATKEAEVVTAQLEQNRQKIANETARSVADADAYIRRTNAQAFASNQAASVAEKQLEIEKIKAEAFLEWAKKGGQLPDVVPENVFMSSDFSNFFGVHNKK